MSSWLNLIGRNGRVLARFTDVAQVQVKTIHGGQDAPDRYRLSIVPNSDETPEVHEFSITEDIALKVEVHGADLTVERMARASRAR